MPKKSKRCKRAKQSGCGLFDDMKNKRWLSGIASPVGEYLGNKATGEHIGNAIHSLGWGQRSGRKRPTGKHMQHGGNSPFMLTHNSSFNQIKM